MDNLKKTDNKPGIKGSKVLDSIKNLKKYKFKKIDTGSILPMRKDKLYIHKCEGYEIEEVKNQINRNPLVLSGVEHKYDNGGKEYILYSPHNQLLQVYPKLQLAKDLVLYALDNNIDFSKDSLERNIHYKRETYIEKNAKKTAERFNEIKKETHNIRKTGQTGGAGNMSKALVNKVNNAHSKLVDSASDSLKKDAIMKIRDLSNYTDSELPEVLNKLVLNMSRATDNCDKYNYSDTYFNNEPLRLDNEKLKAVDNYIQTYCNARERKEIREAFKESNNMILKNYHLKYEL